MKNKATGLAIGYLVLATIAFVNESYFIATVLIIASIFIATRMAINKITKK